MYENIRKEIAKLADELPKGYETFDEKDQPVIQSEMDALDWYRWASGVLTSRGRQAEKEKLRAQLARSVGTDSGGGLLYEFLAALYYG